MDFNINKDTNKIKKHKKKSQMKEVWLRLKKNKLAIVGLVILILILLVSISADLIADYDEVVIKQNIPNRLQGPSVNNILGTDEFGRDIAARIVHGSRVSLSVGFISVFIAVVVGGILGAIAGFYGGKIDFILMRVMDIFLAIPNMLLAIAIVAALGPSMVNLMIAISFSYTPQFARIVRASVISIKDEEFIEAARAIGANNFTIIFEHILINCMAPIIVQVTLKIATAIITVAGLSFIGLGIQPPAPEWGNMLAGGRAYIRDSNYLVLFPGLAIMITILSLNLLGDGLRDALDPKLK